MNLNENEFSKKIKDILAKRACHTCSNPNCKQITSGPHSDKTKAINNGEAAHIRGARPGSARYDSKMTPTQRRDISNGIWLCGRCAGLVDKDEVQFSVESLFSWKELHERDINKRLKGKNPEEVEELNKKFESALERLEVVFKNESQKKVIERLRKNSDPVIFLNFLREESERNKKEFLEINRELYAVAISTGHIEQAQSALRTLLELFPDDLDALNSLGHIYRLKGDFGLAKKNYEQVLELALSKSDKNSVSVAYGNLGAIYITLADFGKAEALTLKSLEISKYLKNRSREADQYGNLGIIYQMIGDYKKAEKYLRMSKELFGELNNKEGLASQLMNLATVYTALGDLDEAEKYLREAVDKNEEIGGQIAIASSLGNLGIFYQNKGDFLKAEEMILKAMDIDRKIGDQVSLAGDYNNLGTLYQRMMKVERAIEMFKKALEINIGINRSMGVAMQYSSLGDSYRILGDYGKAEEMLKKSLKLSSSIGYTHGVGSSLCNLGLLFAVRNDLAQAKQLWARSREVFIKMGAKKEIEYLNELINEVK